MRAADVNHVLHACAHASVEKGRDRLTDDQIFKRVAAYLDAVIEVVRPGRLLVVAVDGVAPRCGCAPFLRPFCGQGQRVHVQLCIVRGSRF